MGQNAAEHSVFGENEPSSFTDLYKYSNRSKVSEAKRRELFLQKQREKRCEAFDEKRNLSELFTEEPPELMECESSSRAKAPKKYPFGFKLMKSEWLTEIPDDFSEKWLFKLGMDGIRFLVVANKACTTCYFDNGRPSFRFKSNLPGGNSQSLSHKFTILDCIYHKDTQTFFVYDVLAWNSLSLINAEAQMRFFWLKSKFEENPEFCETRKFHFVLMEFLPAQCEILQDHLFSPFIVSESELSYQGVFFYHKEGHYFFGSSPLVAWLKTFMLPEILHIDVHPFHLQNKPEDYESMEKYLKEKKSKRKSQKPDSSLVEMEHAEVEDIECDDYVPNHFYLERE